MSRITFTTMYDTTMRGLQRGASKLNKLDEQIISQRRINRPSDDPVGFTHTLIYKNSLNSLSQQRRNMNDGQAYMDTLERTHKSMNNLFENSRDLAVQAATDTVGHSQRLIINLDIRRNLEQLVQLSQARHKDGYIFSGNWTNVPPYEIKKGEVNFASEMYNEITNPNYDKLLGTASLNTYHTIPTDPENSATWTVFNPQETIAINLYNNAYFDQNMAPGAPYPDAQRIIPGSLEIFGIDGLMETPNKNMDLDPLHPDYGKADYELDYAEGKLILLSDKAKQAFYNLDGSKKNASNVQSNAGDPSYVYDSPPPTLSFEYVHRSSLDMTGSIYREIDRDANMRINSDRDDLFGVGAPGETDSFKELIKLMQGLWYNDQPQIAQGIDLVDAAKERNLAEQTVTGARQNRMEMVFDRNKDLEITNTKALSNVESLELDVALSQFAMAEAVYNASLYSASVMMRNTLMDYL